MKKVILFAIVGVLLGALTTGCSDRAIVEQQLRDDVRELEAKLYRAEVERDKLQGKLARAQESLATLENERRVQPLYNFGDLRIGPANVPERTPLLVAQALVDPSTGNVYLLEMPGVHGVTQAVLEEVQDLQRDPFYQSDTVATVMREELDFWVPITKQFSRLSVGQTVFLTVDDFYRPQEGQLVVDRQIVRIHADHQSPDPPVPPAARVLE